jgi:hypothetical protein
MKLMVTKHWRRRSLHESDVRHREAPSSQACSHTHADRLLFTLPFEGPFVERVTGQKGVKGKG